MTAREAILKVVESKFKLTNARLCTVDAVDEDNATCDITTFDTQAEITKVRLQADKGNGVLYIPKVGSMVVAVEVARFEYAIILYSELETIKWLDGSFGGLVKVQQLTTKLNNIEQKVNDLISKFNSHTHTGVSTGGGTSGATPTQVSGTLTETQITDIENPLITHGEV